MAAKVTIDQIKELRDRTGAGLMNCKEALIEADADIEKAIDILREKGIAKAAKKAGRVAAEGLALVKTGEGKAVVAEINCETDFVSSSDKFHEFTAKVMDELFAKGCKTLEEAKKPRRISSRKRPSPWAKNSFSAAMPSSNSRMAKPSEAISTWAARSLLLRFSPKTSAKRTVALP